MVSLKTSSTEGVGTGVESSHVSVSFAFNEALVISDGVHARVESLTADRERFMPWRTVAGAELAPAGTSELRVLLEGMF